MSDKIGVCIASRGMVFSKTMESVIQNLKGKDFELYMAHDLPIPDCFNVPLKRALKDKCKLIWFVEEDMYVPSDTLDKMLALFSAGHSVISSDYADRRTRESLVYRNEKDEILYTGMGCMLVKAELLKKLLPELIQTYVFWLVKNDDGITELQPHPEIKNKGYGTQDVYLCYSLKELGEDIVLVDSKIGHLQLIEKGKSNQNNGAHKIETVYVT